MKMQEEANKSKSNQLATTANMTKQQDDKKQKRNDMKKNKTEKAGCCGGKC